MNANNTIAGRHHHQQHTATNDELYKYKALQLYCKSNRYDGNQRKKLKILRF